MGFLSEMAYHKALRGLFFPFYAGPRLFGLMKGVFAQERKKLRLFPALRRNVIQ